MSFVQKFINEEIRFLGADWLKTPSVIEDGLVEYFSSQILPSYEYLT
jgi:hypothetical protein